MAKQSVEPSFHNLVQGRNGTVKITAFEITQVGQRVFFSGYGSRDREINGGFILDPILAVNVCKAFLEEKGFDVTPIIL